MRWDQKKKNQIGYLKLICVTYLTPTLTQPMVCARRRGLFSRAMAVLTLSPPLTIFRAVHFFHCYRVGGALTNLLKEYTISRFRNKAKEKIFINQWCVQNHPLPSFRAGLGPKFGPGICGFHRPN